MIFDIEYVAKTSYSVEADCLELALEKADRLVLADKEFSEEVILKGIGNSDKVVSYAVEIAREREA